MRVGLRLIAVFFLLIGRYMTCNDEIYVLGDFLYKGDGRKADELLSRLKGKKYLIKGNHEKYL